MKTKYFCSLLFIPGMLALNCANLSGGNGSETTNGLVVGQLLEENGSPAAATRVMLVATGYNPVNDGPVPDSLTDTTDEVGGYSLRAAGGKAFNIEAVQPGSGNRALITGIWVNKNDTDRIPVHTVQKPGAIKFILSPASSYNGNVYIPGTTCFAAIQGGNAIVDSVPPGLVSSVWYAGSGDSSGGLTVAANLMISEGNTIVIANASVWKYSKRIRLNTTVSGADVAGTVTNFPALLRLNSGNFDFSQARADGGDLRFMKENGTWLPFEIERWDAGTRQAEVWVKVDTVFGNDSAHSFIMYWGDSDATISSSGPAVFDTAEGFLGVWHLNQNCRDATGDQHDGVACSAADTAGLIGACKKFTHSDSIIIPGLLGAPQSITLSAWAQLDSTLGSGSEIISIGDAAFIRMDYPANNIGTGGAVHLSDNDSVFAHVGSGKYLKQTGWHFITLTHSGTTFATTAYIDGAVAGVRTDPNKPINYSGLGQNTCIGKHGNGKTGYDFYGKIDEARVYREAVSADYIKLCYMNQRRDDRLVVFK